MSRPAPLALVVEDDETWAAIIRRQLTPLGAVVVTATHAGEAMLQIERQLPQVIVLDMLLHGETGMTLLNELRSHSDLRQIPVIVVSSVVNPAVERALQDYDVFAVLDKTTLTPPRLGQVMERALHG